MKKKIFKDFQFSNQSEAMVAILDVGQGQWKKPTWAFFPGELKIKIRKFYGVSLIDICRSCVIVLSLRCVISWSNASLVNTWCTVKCYFVYQILQK
jgi:hypothetical protein